VKLIVEFHEELEHDLLPDFDLLDLWRGKLSFRRLSLLIQRLPASSAFVSAFDPDAAHVASWGIAEYQRALLIDLFGKANFQNWQPLERPADAVRKQRATHERHRALVERYEARQRIRAKRR
jgi:hypothetical protein